MWYQSTLLGLGDFSFGHVCVGTSMPTIANGAVIPTFEVGKGAVIERA